MWNIKNLTGTLYVQYETRLSNVLQHLYFYDNYLSWGHYVSWEYTNIAGIVRSNINHKYTSYGLNTTPQVSKLDHYCSQVSYNDGDDKNKLGESWEFIFDLMLHDTAVTYIQLAAETDPAVLTETGNSLAELYGYVAMDFYAMSRQLRIDVQRKQNRI